MENANILRIFDFLLVLSHKAIQSATGGEIQMDYKPKANVYKGLFKEFGQQYGHLMTLPSDEFLELAGRMAGYLQGKGQTVTEHIGADSLWIEATPSDIRIQVSPKGLLRIWMEYESFENSEIRNSWRGEFEKLFKKEIFGYGEIRVGNINSTTAHCLEPELEKLIQISERFKNAHMEVKEVLEKFEKDMEMLHENTEAKLREILK